MLIVHHFGPTQSQKSHVRGARHTRHERLDAVMSSSSPDSDSKSNSDSTLAPTARHAQLIHCGKSYEAIMRARDAEELAERRAAKDAA